MKMSFNLLKPSPALVDILARQVSIPLTRVEDEDVIVNARAPEAAKTQHCGQGDQNDNPVVRNLDLKKFSLSLVLDGPIANTVKERNAEMSSTVDDSEKPPRRWCACIVWNHKAARKLQKHKELNNSLYTTLGIGQLLTKVARKINFGLKWLDSFILLDVISPEILSFEDGESVIVQVAETATEKSCSVPVSDRKYHLVASKPFVRLAYEMVRLPSTVMLWGARKTEEEILTPGDPKGLIYLDFVEETPVHVLIFHMENITETRVFHIRGKFHASELNSFEGNCTRLVQSCQHNELFAVHFTYSDQVANVPAENFDYEMFGLIPISSETTMNSSLSCSPAEEYEEELLGGDSSCLSSDDSDIDSANDADESINLGLDSVEKNNNAENSHKEKELLESSQTNENPENNSSISFFESSLNNDNATKNRKGVLISTLKSCNENEKGSKARCTRVVRFAPVVQHLEPLDLESENIAHGSGLRKDPGIEDCMNEKRVNAGQVNLGAGPSCQNMSQARHLISQEIEVDKSNCSVEDTRNKESQPESEVDPNAYEFSQMIDELN